MENDPYERSEEDMQAFGQEKSERLLAETEEALAAERDERDAALSEVADESDPHAWERERIGASLAWWDEDEWPVIDIASRVANDICGYVQEVETLIEHGLPERALVSTVTLDHITGPVIIGALNLLGTLHSHLRETIVPIIKMLNDATPRPTEAEEAARDAAVTALQEEALIGMREQFENMGLQVVGMEEMAEEIAARDESRRDAGLN